MEILAIIPARGGSKGIKRKNLKPILNKPLVAYSILSALNSKYITKVIYNFYIITRARGYSFGCRKQQKKPSQKAKA